SDASGFRQMNAGRVQDCRRDACVTFLLRNFSLQTENFRKLSINSTQFLRFSLQNTWHNCCDCHYRQLV
ncbi:MAG TPA: hypothetical protein PKY59_21255, partial [Pyrinomonadaceae bacterium]|nr:hypothetical protein [Pyrinomonadaceae bacterium]